MNTLDDACDEAAVEAKLGKLRQSIAKLGRVIVAFSAGVDSTLVLKVALKELGRENVLAATGVSASLARRELESVKSLAAILDSPLELVETAEVSNPSYAANPTNRCYYCKTELYSKLTTLAKARGFGAIANGVNMDDLGDYRPGLQAAREFQICSPLVEAGIGKVEVRQMARRLGLPNWEKPALACLSSRVAYGTAVTVGVLSQIEKAEAFLYELGFSGFRVRHHQKVARIELGLADMGRLMADGVRERVVSAFKGFGYIYVTLDLQGFRSGSGNDVLTEERNAAT